MSVQVQLEVQEDIASIDLHLVQLASEWGQSQGIIRRIVASVIVTAEDPPRIHLEERHGFIFVRSVEGTLGSKTRIQPGQLVVRLNDYRLSYGTSSQSEVEALVHSAKSRLVIETIEGWGCPSTGVVTHLVQIEKPHEPIPLGLSFQKQPCGHTWLTKVVPTGLFHVANLPTPCSVVLINGLPCPQTTPEVVKQLTDIFPMASLECREIGLPQTTGTDRNRGSGDNQTSIVDTGMEPVVGEIFTVQLEKPTLSTPLGISLRKSVTAKSIFIAGLSGNSCHTRLEVGQKLLKINGQPCPGSTAETVALLQHLQGRVVLTVATIDWSRTLEQQRRTSTNTTGTTTTTTTNGISSTTPQELISLFSKLQLFLSGSQVLSATMMGSS